MSRSINVSTDVYAAIWAARKSGEDSEDTVLARILECKPRSKVAQVAAGMDRNSIVDQIATGKVGNSIVDQIARGMGVYDARNNVSFKEGFEIFRSYKGKLYSAEARAGVWLRKDTGKTYGTLNQLNSSIASGAENVWNGNWKFRNPQGEEMSINILRN